MLPLESWLIVLLVADVVLVTVGLLWLAARRRREVGVSVVARVRCPADEDGARIRIGSPPAGRDVTVLWCDRFGSRPLTCDRACFTLDVARTVSATA
jgi:hypothetical protein